MKKNQTKQENKNTLLDAEVSDVFVVQNSKKRAYVEQFNHKGVNFTQKKLGTLFGFFIVRDLSSSSANIVNFLTAEIKKEYFAFPKRGMAESFETALHRVNRALAEVVNVGNVDWLGTIDGAVCAIDETKMYFSVTGEAIVLLMRDDVVMNISEGMASEEAKQHPLKTFVDISNGQLMVGDKIIITSPELLDLVSFDELQRNALRLGKDNFVQFINTVLTNECKMAVTSVVDIKEKNAPAVSFSADIKHEMGEENFEDMNVPDNVFSAQVFENDKEELGEKVQEIIADESTDDFQTEGDYIDERTGHIYLQGDEDVENTNQLWSSIKDFFKDTTRSVKESTQKKFRRGKKSVQKFIDSRKSSEIENASVAPADIDYELAKLKEEIGMAKNDERIDEIKVNSRPEKIELDIVEDKEDKKISYGNNKNSIDTTKTKKRKDNQDDTSFKSKLVLEEIDDSIVDKILDFIENIIDSVITVFSKVYKSILVFGKSSFDNIKKSVNKNKTKQKNSKIKSKSEFKSKFNNEKMFNFIEKFKSLFKNIPNKNKIIGLAVLALILVVPLFFINSKQQGGELVESSSTENVAGNQNNNESVSVEPNNQNNNLNADVAVSDVVETEVEAEPKIEGNIDDPEEMYKGTALIYVDKMNEYNIAVTKDNVIVLDNENIKYSLPADAGVIKHVATMDDLNLVFLLTDKNKLFSFSPIDKEFKIQSLNVDVAKVKAIDAYMTYIYIVTDSGIKRHARKEGGFDDGKDWLKEEYKTSKVDNISINENIYLSVADKLEMLFSGKKKDFKLEGGQSVDFVYAKDAKYLWAINKEKATIYKFDRTSGKLLGEFAHNDIKDSVSFTVDENKNIAIITTSKKVLKFELKKK